MEWSWKELSFFCALEKLEIDMVFCDLQGIFFQLKKKLGKIMESRWISFSVKEWLDFLENFDFF